MEHNTRREFVSRLAALTTAGTAATLVSATAKAQSPPNAPFISVKDYGALGTYDPDPEASQPQPDDTDAIQAAINAAVALNRRVYVPVGRYQLTSPLTMKLGMVLEGESEYGSILHQTAAQPIFVNEPGHADFFRTRISSITLLKGTHAHKYTLTGIQRQSLGDWVRVRFEEQTTCAIECSQNFLANNFYNCVFFFCTTGLKVDNGANLNNFIACRFENLSNDTIVLSGNAGRGGESNNFIGCRFEARKNPSDAAKAVFTLVSCANTLIEGCYFEDTWTRILDETGAANTNTTCFRSNKFSGQEVNATTPGPKQEIFESDGTVTFDNNFFEFGSSSQSTCSVHLIGGNRALDSSSLTIYRDGRNPNGGRVLTKPWTPASGVPVNLFQLSRTNTAADPANCASVGGSARLTVSALDTNGVPMFISRSFPFVITALASGTMSVAFGAATGADNNPAGGVISLTAPGGTPSALTIQATLSGSLLVARVRADIEWEVSFNPPYPAPVMTVLQ